jgi:hypothetical protein
MTGVLLCWFGLPSHADTVHSEALRFSVSYGWLTVSDNTTAPLENWVVNGFTGAALTYAVLSTIAPDFLTRVPVLEEPITGFIFCWVLAILAQAIAWLVKLAGRGRHSR